MGSLVFAPGEPITFGILHCIAVASLLAAPFVTAPAWASLAAGLVAIAAPFLVHSTLFDPPWLLWLGFGEALPNTLDWRPLLPWAGVVFLGLGVARLPGVIAWLTSPERWRAESAPARAIMLRRPAQPADLSRPSADPDRARRALTAWGPLAPKPDRSAFLAACQRACVAKGGRRPNARPPADASPTRSSARATPTGWRRSTPERRAELKRLADACMGR